MTKAEMAKRNEDIVQAYKAGDKVVTISERFDLKIESIYRILRGLIPADELKKEPIPKVDKPRVRNKFELPFKGGARKDREYSIYICPTCGHRFCIMNNYGWAYRKEMLGTRTFCSYSCMRKAEKMYEEYLAKKRVYKTLPVSRRV